MAVQSFLRDLDGLFNYSTDENPTSQQDYQEAVKNWVDTVKSLVDCTLWQPNTEYAAGNVLRTPSLPYELQLTCITAGTSGSAEPDYTDVSLGDTITDGTVTWVVDGYLPLSGGTMTGDIEFYDDLYLGSPLQESESGVWSKTEYPGLYSNKNNPHNYSGIAFYNVEGERAKTLISAGDGTNRNYLTIFGDAEGGIVYNSASLTNGTFLTTRYVYLIVSSSPTNNVGTLTAPAVSGYKFIGWFAVISSGGVFPCYAEEPSLQTTAIWVPTSHLSVAAGKRAYGYALYVRQW